MECIDLPSAHHLYENKSHLHTLHGFPFLCQHNTKNYYKDYHTYGMFQLSNWYNNRLLRHCVSIKLPKYDYIRFFHNNPYSLHSPLDKIILLPISTYCNCCRFLVPAFPNDKTTGQGYQTSHYYHYLHYKGYGDHVQYGKNYEQSAG